MILVKHNNEGNLKPYFYFALEQYILNEVLKNDEIYFFTWKIEGIVSGKNQVIENEINFPYIKANNINFYRRPTGGGTVYADQENTMFSIIAKRSKTDFSFKKYLQLLIDAFKKLGVNIEFSGRNDLLLDGRKISGNAFLQNKNGMLMHGTLMYDLNIDTMVRALTPPDEKLISKGIASVSSRVNNLKSYLNGMTHDELIDYLGSELTDQVYELKDEEIERLKEDAKYYMTDKFLYQDQPKYSQKFAKRYSFGMLEIRINIADGLMHDFKLNGDFFNLINDLSSFEENFNNQEYSFNSIKEILKKVDIASYILGATNDDLLDLLESGFLKV